MHTAENKDIQQQPSASYAHTENKTIQQQQPSASGAHGREQSHTTSTCAMLLRAFLSFWRGKPDL